MGFMARLTKRELVAYVEASCASQGVPRKVTDAGVVSRMAVLLSGRATPSRFDAAASDDSGRDPDLDAPPDVGSGGVRLLGPGRTGGNHDVVDESGDDGVLASQVEFPPLFA